MRLVRLAIAALASAAIFDDSICSTIRMLGPEQTRIGCGGQGNVFLLEVNDTQYVRKEFRRTRHIDREMNVTREMVHPAILTPECQLSAHSTITRFFSDGTLAHVSRLTHSDAQRRLFAAQIVSAIMHVHDHDIVHVDIKPYNIVREGNQVAIIDFGLARHASEMRSMIGTEDWMSPEMMSDSGQLHEAVDWWSVGLVLLAINTDIGGRHRPTMSAIGKLADSRLADLVRMLTTQDPNLRRFKSERDRLKLTGCEYFRGVRWDEVQAVDYRDHPVPPHWAAHPPMYISGLDVQIQAGKHAFVYGVLPPQYLYTDKYSEYPIGVEIWNDNLEVTDRRRNRY